MVTLTANPLMNLRVLMTLLHYLCARRLLNTPQVQFPYSQRRLTQRLLSTPGPALPILDAVVYPSASRRLEDVISELFLH